MLLWLLIGAFIRKGNTLSLLSRFVVDKDGKRLGESISVYNDLLIIKKEGKFYAIPLKHIATKGEHLAIKGIVQWDIAEKLAQEWKKDV